ncbi:MAG: helix-turn-helix transcriptional regulator [Flavobacteriales bacterium]|nr:helix-turn-helix transcriptional regulator [Flavobacteriales bacterium]MCB9191929.1 helix-turn-helix transcriptional regulator [Flavobacteriales bacterium]
MATAIGIYVNEKVYLKDPESSELGKKILETGIDMIDEVGFESFTFRKLALEIGSTEASVYRYFESKHRLLLYLTCWYWRWIDYKLMLATTNITDAEERLKRAMGVLVKQVEVDSDFSHINEVKLNRIIISESSKAYLNKHVDEENKEGFFLDYKELVERVSSIILEINPNYPYPHMMVSTLIEGAHLQRFFADHLPRLTNDIKGEDSVTEFCLQTILKAIK